MNWQLISFLLALGFGAMIIGFMLIVIWEKNEDGYDE